jgi:hypothetical protein
MHAPKCGLECHRIHTLVVGRVDLSEAYKGPSCPNRHTLKGSSKQGNEPATDEDWDKRPMDDVEYTRSVASEAADEEEQRELGAVDAEIEYGLADRKRLWESALVKHAAT